MNIGNSILAISRWAEDKICSQVKFKRADNDCQDVRYSKDYVNPQVFSLFVPPGPCLEGVEVASPFLCVQLLQGEDSVVTGWRRLRFRFVFSVWNPGVHEDLDLYVYKGYRGDFKFPFVRCDERKAFTPTEDGWLDLCNFMDVALTSLEEGEFPEGMMLNRSEGGTNDEDNRLRYGVFWPGDSASSSWPYFSGWMEFTLEGRISGTRDMEDF